MAYKRQWRRSAIACIDGGNCEHISVQWLCKAVEFYLLKEFLLYHIDLQLTVMQSHLKGIMLPTRISCHGNGSRSPLPKVTKNIGIKVILTKMILFVS